MGHFNNPLCIEEEAALGLLRLKSNNQWINEPMVNQKGYLTTHTKRCNKLLSGVSFAGRDQDHQTSALNLDTSFGIEIPVLADYTEPVPNENTIMCYTDGSMMNDKVGAGVFIPDPIGNGPPIEKSYHIGEHSTVFQAETFAVQQAAKLLRDNGTKNNNNKIIKYGCLLRTVPKEILDSLCTTVLIYLKKLSEQLNLKRIS